MTLAVPTVPPDPLPAGKSAPQPGDQAVHLRRRRHGQLVHGRRVPLVQREDVVVEFQDLDKKGQRTPIPLWMERNAERIPWVKEEYERVKGGKLATTAGDIPHAVK